MKLCLLMHGQARFLENHLPLESHKKEILDKYFVDVICHTWFGEGYENETSSWSGIPSTLIRSDTIDLIQKKYKPLIMSHDKPMHFELDPGLESGLLDKFKSYNHWNKTNISNSLSSLYSIERVVDIASSLDLANYDFVILSRYDNMIYKLPDLNLLEKDKFYISDHHDKFPDLFFIFSPKFLEAFRIYSNSKSLISQNINSLYPESSLNESLKMLRFYSIFDDAELKPIPLPVRVVRDGVGRGDTSQLQRYNLITSDLMIDWTSINDVKFYCEYLIKKYFFGKFKNIISLRLLAVFRRVWRWIKC